MTGSAHSSWPGAHSSWALALQPLLSGHHPLASACRAAPLSGAPCWFTSRRRTRMRGSQFAKKARPWIAAIAASLFVPIALVAAATAAPASTTAPLLVTTTSPLTATAGSAYLAKLDATGGTKPYSWSLGGGTSPPAGLVLHAATGQITGKPVGPAGTSDFIAEVTDSESSPASATALESITVIVTRSHGGGGGVDAAGAAKATHRAALAALTSPAAGQPDPARLAHHADAAGDARRCCVRSRGGCAGRRGRCTPRGGTTVRAGAEVRQHAGA